MALTMVAVDSASIARTKAGRIKKYGVLVSSRGHSKPAN